MLTSLLIVASCLLWAYLSYGNKKFCASLTSLFSLSKNPGWPGPRGFPIAGNAPQFDISHLHRELQAMGRIYGDAFRIKLQNQEFIVLNTPSLIREALIDKGRHWAGRLQTFRSEVAVDNLSMFTLNHAGLVKKGRNCQGRGVLVFGSANRGLEDCIMSALTEFLDDLDQQVGRVFNPHEHVACLLQRISAIMLCGHDVPKDDRLLKLIGKFADALREAVAISPTGLLVDNLPWVRYIPGLDYAYKKAITVAETRTTIWNDYISKNMGELPRSYLSALIETHGEQIGTQPDDVLQEKHIRGLMGDLFFGGALNSLDVLYALVNVLCHFPGIQEKMAAEIQKESPGESLVTAAHKDNLPYCRATLIEIFRYSSLTPFVVPRVAVEDTEIQGMKIGKGTALLANSWAAHHDQRFWSDPEKFVPERFLDAEGNLVSVDHPNRKNMSGFGAGVRRCIGQNFASNNMLVILTNLVKKFKMSPSRSSTVKSGTTGCDPSKWNLYGIALQVPQYEIILNRRAT